MDASMILPLREASFETGKSSLSLEANKSNELQSE
jgi:hypothetical protein